MKRLTGQLGWAALSLIGAASIACIAVKRGETINAVWIVAADAAVCVYLIACRFYRKFIADKVIGLMSPSQTRASIAHLCAASASLPVVRPVSL